MIQFHCWHCVQLEMFITLHKMRSDSTNSPPKNCSVALWWVSKYRIKCPSPNMKESEKLITDLLPVPHQNVITSRGSSLARAYRACLTFINVFVSYPVHNVTDRQTDRQQWSHNSRWPLSRQCEIPWWFAALLHGTRHVKCYSYHARSSVSGGGRNATVHDPKPYT